MICSSHYYTVLFRENYDGEFYSGLGVVWLDLWSPLGDFSHDNNSAPQDLFIVLFDTVDDFLSPGPAEFEFIEIQNDPMKSSTTVPNTQRYRFTNEFAIINFRGGSPGNCRL